MAKYSKAITEKICKSLRERKGRMNACKEAGITHQTFRTWMADETKPLFSLAIKKAEEDATQDGKEVAILHIFSHMQKNWQAAAWWLERNFPDQYRNVQETKEQIDLNIGHNVKGKKEDV